MNTGQIEAQLAGISFSDARIQNIALQNGNVRINLQDWQGKSICLQFSGIVYFKAFEFGSDISEVMVGRDTPEIAEARRIQERDGVTDAASLTLIQVSFIGDNPIVVVVLRDFASGA